MGIVRYYFNEDDNTVGEIHKVPVFKFSYPLNLIDPTDNQLYSSKEMQEYFASEDGKFILKNNLACEICKQIDFINHQYIVALLAELDGKKLSEYYLRFDIIK
jgi:hypothetical protein